jgi:hypothetical protein
MTKPQQPAKGPNGPASSVSLEIAGGRDGYKFGYNDPPPKAKYSMNQQPSNMQKPPPPPPPPPKK